MSKTRKSQTRKSQRQKSQTRKPKDVVVGVIHANWCGHCQLLMPEWNKMKQMSNNDGVKFVEFEESRENREQEMKNLHPDLKIEGGFPTIFKIVGGKIEYYNGDRTAEEIRSWALNIKKSEREPESTQSDRTFLGRMFGGYVYKKARFTRSSKSQYVRSKSSSKKRKTIKTRRIGSPVEKLN